MTFPLTNEQINSNTNNRVANHQRNVQANRVIPVQIEVSTEITIGRAILDAVQADPALAAAIGYADNNEQALLDSIEGIAFVSPSNIVALKAYAGATTHSRAIPAAVTTYIPAAGILHNYIEGVGNEVIDVLI